MKEPTATVCGHQPHSAKGLCQKCYFRKWADANRERTREYARAYAATHREYAAEKTRKWYADNLERARETNRAWYRDNKEAALAYRKANAESIAERQRAYRKANAEYISRRQGAYQKANPERSRVKGNRRRALMRRSPVNDLTFEHWQRLLEQFDYQCFYCGDGSTSLQMEHMTPLSRGGAHTAGNIVPACGPCNGRKGVQTAEEFLGLHLPEDKSVRGLT